MRLPIISLLSALLVGSVMQVSAQDVEISITPAPGEYETLPTQFTINYSGEGLTSVTKNIAGGSTMLITAPDGTTKQQITGTFSGTTVTCTIPGNVTFPLDKNGEYIVQLRANAVYYNWTDGTKTKCEVKEFTYSVKGKEEENPQPDLPKDVVYDIELQKTTPSLNPYDLNESDLDILQLYFNMGNLQLEAGATATITGPEYSKTATLQPNMNMATSTVFKANFTNPTYSGTYTLTIPQGVMGDEEWIKDHKYGHSNAEIKYEFEVIHGRSTDSATVTISPEPGEYDTLPETFVVTVDGPESVAKNVTGPNPLLIITPKGTRQQVTGQFSGNTITCNVPAGVAKDEAGEYTVQYCANAVTYIWPGDTKGYSEEVIFTYNIKGKEDQQPEGPKEVAYDIEMNKTIPNLDPLDLEMRGLETLQIYFNMADLRLDPNADAYVTITGPNYYGNSQLVMNMNMPTATVFKASFNDPKYSGEYTLTIPKGILGDEVWIKDHKMGHTNAEVVYHFTVTGGEDPSTITRDLTFNPRITPTSGAKVSDLSHITLAFNSIPYWDSDADIEVLYRADLSDSGVDTHFGNASLSKGEGNNLILTITPTPRSIGQYSLTLPEGIIWNDEHEADDEAGALNAEMYISWFLTSVESKIEVTGHIPATDAYVGNFPAGKECIVIMTNLKNEVASADFELIEYKLNDESSVPKTLLSTTSTDFNDNGYICWINNTGSDIDLKSDYYYEVVFTLKNANGNTLVSDSFEFYGDYYVGIGGIGIDQDSDKIFNLQGLEVTGHNLPAGIYIKNGKKLVIR